MDRKFFTLLLKKKVEEKYSLVANVFCIIFTYIRFNLFKVEMPLLKIDDQPYNTYFLNLKKSNCEFFGNFKVLMLMWLNF